MEPLTPTSVFLGAVNLAVIPLILWFIKRTIEKLDEKHDDARAEKAELERKKVEQRNAEHTIILAMCRTMLLNNWEKCMDKGSYTIEERKVYHELYEAYKEDGGNSIIDEIAPRIRALPMESPMESPDN